MTSEEYRKSVGSLRSKLQKSINDTYIWYTTAIVSFDLALSNQSLLTSMKFEVPSKRPQKTVRRNRAQVERILARARDNYLFESIFSYLVSQVEAFFQDILVITLRFDNTKIKTRIHGIEHLKSVKVEEIVDRKTRKALIESIIQKELLAVFYARPSAQFQYIESVTGARLEDDLKNEWAEIKATRDLLVHNSGKINTTYLMKAGESARGSVGETIAIDKAYIEYSIVNMKTLVGKMSADIQRAQKSKTKSK